MRRYVLACCLLLHVGTAHAGGRPLLAVKAAEWNRRFTDIDAHLRRGEWAEAETRRAQLARDITELVTEGEGEAKLAGMLLVLRAVGEQGRGDAVGAQYWWWAAQQVWPDAKDFDLARFGEVGIALHAHGAPLREPRARSEAGTVVLIDRTTVPSDAIEPPKLIERAPLDFPQGKLHADVARGEVIVEVVIDASGRTTRPILRGPQPAPLFTMATLESLARWRYEPARLDGKPQAVFMNARVKFNDPPTRPKKGKKTAPATSAPPPVAEEPGESEGVDEGPGSSPVAITGDMVPPRLVHRVPPRQHGGATGEVVLRCIITEKGRVASPEITQSAGRAADAAALDAVKQWRYAPATRNGQPQAVYLVVKFKFR